MKNKKKKDKEQLLLVSKTRGRVLIGVVLSIEESLKQTIVVSGVSYIFLLFILLLLREGEEEKKWWFVIIIINVIYTIL